MLPGRLDVRGRAGTPWGHSCQSNPRLIPSPGTATVKVNVDRIRTSTGRICELVDGTLVRKLWDITESNLAGLLIHFIRQYLGTNNTGHGSCPRRHAGDSNRSSSSGRRCVHLLGAISGRQTGQRADSRSCARLWPWKYFLKSNTSAEMKRKRREYFEAGVQLVWLIDPKFRTADVYTAPEESTFIDCDGVLLGGNVLPGFNLPLKELFAGAEPPATDTTSTCCADKAAQECLRKS